jgi:hypothetical protein
MQIHSVASRGSADTSGALPPLPSPETAARPGRRRVGGSPRIAGPAFLLLAVLAGCAARAPHPDVIEPQGSLSERTAERLISVWETRLARYIDQEGGGDPGVLAQTRALHSRDILRPARITFDALDVDAQVPSRDGWDVEGLLIGKQSSGTRNWYVFLVGIVARGGYRPSSIQDIRMVGLSAEKGVFTWVKSRTDREAVKRYRETFRRSSMVRFPGDTDRFVMHVSEDRTSVQELRSGADWSLQLTSGMLERDAINAETRALVRTGAR